MELATAFVTIRPQTDGFEAELASSVGGLETEVPLTADTSDLEGAIDEVAGDVEVGVDADVSDAEASIDGIEGSPVEIPVTADTSGAEEQVGGLSDQISGLMDGLGGGGSGGATGALDAFSGAALGAGSASSIASTGGLAALAAGLGYAVSEGAEAQVTVSQLDQMVANMGVNAGVTSSGLQALATDIMETAGFSDEAVMSGEAMVLMFENVRNTANQPIFDRTIRSSADLARSPAFNGDIESAARTLGRALDDPVSGMGRLRRAGIQLTDSQEETIRSLQESGNMAGAQAALLDIVDGKVGGLAERYAGDFTGSVDRAKEAVGEMAEAMGAQMLPALEAVSLSVIDQVDRLNSWDTALDGALFSGPVQAILGIGDGIEVVGTVIGELPPPLRDTAAAAGEAASEVDSLAQSTDAYVSGLFSVPGAQREARQSFADLSTAMAEGTWDEQAVAMEGVVISTANLIAKQREQGATTAELDATIYGSIATLAQMRNAGVITGAQFDTLSQQIRDVPHQATTQVSTPGIEGAISNLRTVKTTIDGIERDIVVRVSVPNLGAIAADVAGAAASLRSLRDVETVGAGVGRSAVASTAPVTIIHQTVMPNGDVLAEASFEHNRRLAMAEGYES